MLRDIQLHGVLGEKFGKHFQLDVMSPKEACTALCYQLEGFKEFMLNAKNDGLMFAVFNDDENIGEDEISNNTGASTIRIVPEIVGAGGDVGGILQVVAGAALVAFSFGNPAMIGAGVGLMIGGVSTLLMPTPNIQPGDREGNKASYAFGGAVTTVAQGNPVPILFGRREIGGFVISVSMVNEDT